MRITPDLKTLRALAKEGKYDVAPVRCELLSDIRTPIEALKILKNVSTHCFLLESVTEREKWGRYTFLGFDPKMSITCTDGRLQAGSLTLETDDPSACLRTCPSSPRRHADRLIRPLRGVSRRSADRHGHRALSQRGQVSPWRMQRAAAEQ